MCRGFAEPDRAHDAADDELALLLAVTWAWNPERSEHLRRATPERSERFRRARPERSELSHSGRPGAL